MTDTVQQEGRIIALLAARGLTLATAESCTGGLIAHTLTNVPGASACFLGGAVTYSNASKCALLSVPVAVIEAHGAVSEPVALAMADGARARFASDFAVAVTGIAGPGGGTPEKPVGLVWMAVAGPAVTRAKCCRFDGDRLEIKRATAHAALAFLREILA